MDSIISLYQSIVIITRRIGTVYEDVTSDVLGKIGNWQWLVTVLSTVLTFPSLFNQYEDMFLLRPSKVFCIPPSELEVINSSLCFLSLRSNVTDGLKCEKWHLKLLGIIWITKTWLVFCDNKLKLLSTAIISRFGSVFGCIIFGFVSDSFGRRIIIILCVFAELIFGLVITFCDSEGWFRLVTFLKSLFGSANFYMGIVLVCEIASNKWRSWLCVVVITPRLIRMACMVPLANSAPNAETYSFVACIFCFLCLILLRWIPESPQWLLFNRKIIVAQKYLVKAAKTNGINICGDFKIRPVNHRAYHSLENTTPCIGLLATYNVKVIFLMAVTFWFLYYYMWSSLYVKMYSEENNNYMLLSVFCFVVVLGCLTIYLSVNLRLRHLLQVHIIFTGVVTAGIVFFEKGTIQTIVSSGALASGLIAHSIILNITPRFFAINIRATVFGTCHATGQLGSIVSYLLYLFHPLNHISFMTVKLLVTIITVGLCFLMPDVDYRELPDILKDMDYFSELSKPLRWATQKTYSPSLEEVQMRVYSFGSTQRSLSCNLSEGRTPAKRIGFIQLWHAVTGWVRQKFLARRHNQNT